MIGIHLHMVDIMGFTRFFPDQFLTDVISLYILSYEVL